MKILTICLLPTLVVGYLSANQKSGAELYQEKCANCHMTIRPIDRSKLIAPPAMGITRHVKMRYPKRDDAVKFIVDYIKNPSRKKALCKSQSIQRFGVMPSQKGLLSDEEFTKIANYLYDNFGDRGQGHGRGRGGRQGRGF